MRMDGFPKYSLRGLEGRRIMGVGESLVVVEGISDVWVYQRFIDDRKRLMPVEDIADVRSNREAIVSMSTDFPEHSFIVDEDLMTLSEEESQESLPGNLATTWELNDIECWAFHALDQAGRLDQIGITPDDVGLAVEMSKKFGLMRLISKRMGGGASSRWRLDFDGCKDSMLRHPPRIQIDHDVVEMVVRRQTRDTVSAERWRDKVRKAEREFSGTRSLKLVAGHDLTFFLYYACAQRNGRAPTSRGKRDFERLLVNKSLRYRQGWNGLISGKIAGFLRPRGGFGGRPPNRRRN